MPIEGQITKKLTKISEEINVPTTNSDTGGNFKVTEINKSNKIENCTKKLKYIRKNKPNISRAEENPTMCSFKSLINN
jgi:hypothetical protein